MGNQEIKFLPSLKCYPYSFQYYENNLSLNFFFYFEMSFGQGADFSVFDEEDRSTEKRKAESAPIVIEQKRIKYRVKYSYLLRKICFFVL